MIIRYVFLNLRPPLSMEVVLVLERLPYMVECLQKVGKGSMNAVILNSMNLGTQLFGVVAVQTLMTLNNVRIELKQHGNSIVPKQIALNKTNIGKISVQA